MLFFLWMTEDSKRTIFVLTVTADLCGCRRWRGDIVVLPERHSAQPGLGVRQEHVLEVLVRKHEHLHPLAGAGLHSGEEAGTSWHPHRQLCPGPHCVQTGQGRAPLHDESYLLHVTRHKPAPRVIPDTNWSLGLLSSSSYSKIFLDWTILFCAVFKCKIL